jgi:predicted enzyme related to lactoylglutathione lyase
MPAKLCHFAINADDVQRARRFYESVFDWTFEPWGPPNFYQVKL